jgi:hypothetical protein
VADVHGKAFRLKRLPDKGRRLFFVFNHQHAHDSRIAETLKASNEIVPTVVL